LQRDCQLPKIARALGFVRFSLRIGNRKQQERRKNRDNRKSDEKFDECESSRLMILAHRGEEHQYAEKVANATSIHVLNFAVAMRENCGRFTQNFSG